MPTFDKQFCTTLRSELNAALKEVADRHGIVIEAQNMTFGPSRIDVKVAAMKIEGGVKMTKEAERAATESQYIFGRNVLGEEIDGPDGRYVITGFRARNAKNRVLARKVADGKTYALNLHATMRTMKVGPFAER